MYYLLIIVALPTYLFVAIFVTKLSIRNYQNKIIVQVNTDNLFQILSSESSSHSSHSSHSTSSHSKFLRFFTQENAGRWSNGLKKRNCLL